MSSDRNINKLYQLKIGRIQSQDRNSFQDSVSGRSFDSRYDVLKLLKEQLHRYHVYLDLSDLAHPAYLSLHQYNDTIKTIYLARGRIKVYLPGNYSLTTDGWQRLEELITAELAVSCILWKWLNLEIRPDTFKSLKLITPQQGEMICKLDYLIDLFLLPFPDLLKEEVELVLLDKYRSELESIKFFDYHREYLKSSLLILVESINNQELDLKLLEEKLRLYNRELNKLIA